MLVTVGYFVVQWPIPDLLKFLMIITVSFFVILGLYEFGVRRFNLLRFLFGMKLLRSTQVPIVRQDAMASIR